MVDPQLLAAGLMLAGATTAALILARRTRSKSRGVLADLARSLDGRVAERGWFQPSAVLFHTDGQFAELSCGLESRLRRGASHPFTSFHLFGRVGVLRVVSAGAFAETAAYFGTQDIHVGDAEFERRFVVHGESPEWVCDVLQAEVRNRLFRLLAYSSGNREGGVRIQTGPTGVCVRIDHDLGSRARDLESFLDHSLAIARQVRMPMTCGVEVLGVSELVAQGRCPVCGHALSSDAVACPTCSTRHHADCWEYFGGCAIYACREAGGDHRAPSGSASPG